MASTNFFFVRDVSAFLTWVGSQNLIAVPGVGADEGKFSLRPKSGEGFRLRPGSEDDMLDGLSTHLAPNSIARVDSGAAVSIALPRALRWAA